MKRFIRAAALLTAALICAVSLGGCGLFGGGGESPAPIDIPTSEPTGEPSVLENSVLEGFIGDWYGVYTVAEAKGVYAPNSGVRNDCAMRVSVDSYGSGSCYLQVNGMKRDAVSGSSNLFALCTARISEGVLLIEGMINTFPVEWEFRKADDTGLTLTEVYGDVNDHMRIEIDLVRPDSFAGSSVSPEGLDYLIKNGFGRAVDLLGGSTADLPEIRVPEGCDPHIVFDGRGTTPFVTPVPTEAPGSVLSADGRIRVTLPNGYIVVNNTVMNFSVACPDRGILITEFTVSYWETDALSFLMGNTPNVTELYHYSISGYDFYGTFVTPNAGETDPDSSEEPEPTPNGNTVFKLCGTDGSGTLIIITMTMSLDAYNAYRYVNVDNDDFTKLILGAEFYE